MLKSRQGFVLNFRAGHELVKRAKVNNVAKLSRGFFRKQVVMVKVSRFFNTLPDRAFAEEFRAQGGAPVGHFLHPPSGRGRSVGNRRGVEGQLHSLLDPTKDYGGSAGLPPKLELLTHADLVTLTSQLGFSIWRRLRKVLTRLGPFFVDRERLLELAKIAT